MTKRTYQPNKLKRVKQHGFRARMSARKGGTQGNLIKSRRNKGRLRLSVSARPK